MRSPEDEETRETTGPPGPPAPESTQPSIVGTPEEVAPAGDAVTPVTPTEQVAPPDKPPIADAPPPLEDAASAPAADRPTDDSQTTETAVGGAPTVAAAPAVPPPPPAPPPPGQGQQPAGQWPQQQPAGQWQQQQAGQWQQQQPGQWQQQPTQQWQGSAYGQPPYPPQYWTQPAPAYGSSGLVVVASLLLALFGLIDIAGGVWLYGQGSELNSFIQRTTVNLFGANVDRQTLRAILGATPPALIVFGVLEVIFAFGALAHQGWARALGIVIAFLGILIGIVSVSVALALAPGFSVPMAGAIVVLLGYAFILLALSSAGGHFHRTYPRR
jgi:hypothetical protein